MLRWTVQFITVTVVAIVCCLLPINCTKDANPQAIEEQTVGNGPIAVYAPDGMPVQGATVKIVPVEFVPGNTMAKTNGSQASVFSATTDANGRFSTALLAEGNYNIMASYIDGDTLVSFADSVYISENYASIVSDTLAAGVTYRAYATVQANHDPRTVIVLVLGTLHYANVGADGMFTLANMAPGRYPIRLVSTEQGYTPTFATVLIAQEMTAQPDTFDLIYTGIPCVKNIGYVWDSQRSVARVFWDPVQYRLLQDYYVQIENANMSSSEYYYDLSGYTTDTSYVMAVCPPASFRIKVSVRTISGGIGEACEFAEFSQMAAFQPPPSTFDYKIRNHTAGHSDARGAISDNFTISATVRNPALPIEYIRWLRIDDGYLYPWDLSYTYFGDSSMRSETQDVISFDFRCKGTHYIICELTLRTPCGIETDYDTISFNISNPAEVNPARVTNGSMVRIDVAGLPVPGSSTGEVFAYSFWIDTTEVTRGDYFSVTGDSTPIPVSSTCNYWGGCVALPPYHLPQTLPADNMTWYDAVLYCNARSKRDGYDTVYTYSSVTFAEYSYFPDMKSAIRLQNLVENTDKNGYRLPAKAEMLALVKPCEACPRGMLSDSLAARPYDYGWFYEQSNEQAHGVALKKPFYDGVYDVIGNMAEWLDDKGISPDGSYGRAILFSSWVQTSESVLETVCYPEDYYSWFAGFRCVRREM